MVAGAGGPVGRWLAAAARDRYEVVVLTRGRTRVRGARSVRWDPAAAGGGDDDALEALAGEIAGAAAVVNLAGASISAGRLGPRHVERLRTSREAAAATLLGAIARATPAPACMVQASGVDIYRPAGDRVIDEQGAQDDGRLAAVLAATEAAAAPAARHCRLVIVRFGIVLARDAPAWRLILLPIRLLIGGPLGPGSQWWSWVHAADVARALLWLVEHPEAEGVYNVVGAPVRQVDLARAAARRLRRPALVPVPGFALRIVVGGLAEPLLLASKRVVAGRLEEAGFTFAFADAEAALDDLLP